MYKVIDVAKLFSVSKVTIYKKITANKNELKGHIIKKKNITYLDDEAIDIIKNSLQVNKEKASGRLIDEELDKLHNIVKELSESNEALKNEKVIILKEELNELESIIRHLNSQLQVKKNHLKTKEEILINFKGTLKLNKDRIKLLDGLIEEFEKSV